MGGKLFLSEIEGKPVKTAGGRMLGILDGVVTDTANGDLVYILVRPEGAMYTDNHKVDDKGRYVIQVDTVTVEPDCIVVK